MLGFSNISLSLSGLLILGNAIVQALSVLHAFAIWDTVKSFLLPITLTVSYLPFVYLFALYLLYEKIYIRFKMKVYIDNELKRYIIQRLFLKFGFKIKTLKDFHGNSLNNLLRVRPQEEAKVFFDTMVL